MATTEGQSVKATTPQSDGGGDRLTDVPFVQQVAAELVFESTKEFEDDVKRLVTIHQSCVADSINRQCQLLLSDRKAFEGQLSRPFVPVVSEGLDSSLYVLDLGDGYSAILTVDDDPIFGRIVVTLFRLVARCDVEEGYRATASTLYEEF